MTTQRAVGAGTAFTGGVALAVQGRVNGQLGDGLHDGVLAALLSTVGGLIVLAVAAVALPAGRRAVRRLPGLRWWQYLGGVSGAFLVACQGLTVGTLGVAFYTVAVVAGQSVSSLAVDRLGVGPAGTQPLSLFRVIGAGLAVVGVLVAVSADFGDLHTLGLAVLPALAGVLVAWQVALNGRVRDNARSAMAATLVNFTVGTVALLLVYAVDLAVTGWPTRLPGPWWLYLGGLLGIVAVGTAAIAVRLVGVLVVGLSSVAGQLIGALLLDLAARQVALATALGALIVLGAVAVAGVRQNVRRDRHDP